MRRPCVECGAFLLCPIVPLIYPDYASPTSAQMIQHRLGDFETDAEALQPCRKRPAQVMQPPAGNTRRGVRALTSLSTSRRSVFRARRGRRMPASEVAEVSGQFVQFSNVVAQRVDPLEQVENCVFQLISISASV